MFGWDQTQARTWHGTCQHTALAALTQLRAAAIRNALTGSIALPAVNDTAGQHPPDPRPATGDGDGDDQVSQVYLDIRTPRAPVPALTAASPKNPRSTRSSCRSPKPPGWPTSLCATPAG